MNARLENVYVQIYLKGDNLIPFVNLDLTCLDDIGFMTSTKPSSHHIPHPTRLVQTVRGLRLPLRHILRRLTLPYIKGDTPRSCCTRGSFQTSRETLNNQSLSFSLLPSDIVTDTFEIFKTPQARKRDGEIKSSLMMD